MTDITQQYKQHMQELFTYEYHLPDTSLMPMLSVIPAIRNGTTLLTGTYGTGKTTLIDAYARRFFVDAGEPSLGRVRCHQELMDTDTLYAVSFSNPDAPVTPRALLYKRFRYINELPRSNPAWQNALLSFFSEGEVTFRDQHFTVPDGINLCDRNPDDMGQEGVVRAVLDRMDHEVIIPDNSYRPRISITNTFASPLSTPEMENIWQAVERMKINATVWDYAHMLNHYFSACLHPRSISNRLFELPCMDCAHKAEVCSSLRNTPGQRGLISMLRLARAFAWWNGASEVSVDDVDRALPFSYAHRLDFHSEVFREWPNPQEYLRQHIIGGHIAAKREKWLEAIQAKLDKDHERILSIAGAADDLVIAWLYTKCVNQGHTETRKEGEGL
ncbi:MAG: AAA family ATPase [Mariprofundus sp.]|nr:AAA family ATPase [Mariprofundus sp.]